MTSHDVVVGPDGLARNGARNEGGPAIARVQPTKTRARLPLDPPDLDVVHATLDAVDHMHAAGADQAELHAFFFRRLPWLAEGQGKTMPRQRRGLRGSIAAAAPGLLDDELDRVTAAAREAAKDEALMRLATSVPALGLSGFTREAENLAAQAADLLTDEHRGRASSTRKQLIQTLQERIEKDFNREGMRRHAGIGTIALALLRLAVEQFKGVGVLDRELNEATDWAIFPGTAKLARQTGLSENTVQRSLPASVAYLGGTLQQTRGGVKGIDPQGRAAGRIHGIANRIVLPVLLMAIWCTDTRQSRRLRAIWRSKLHRFTAEEVTSRDPEVRARWQDATVRAPDRPRQLRKGCADPAPINLRELPHEGPVRGGQYSESISDSEPILAAEADSAAGDVPSAGPESPAAAPDFFRDEERGGRGEAGAVPEAEAPAAPLHAASPSAGGSVLVAASPEPIPALNAATSEASAMQRDLFAKENPSRPSLPSAVAALGTPDDAASPESAGARAAPSSDSVRAGANRRWEAALLDRVVGDAQPVRPGGKFDELLAAKTAADEAELAAARLRREDAERDAAREAAEQAAREERAAIRRRLDARTPEEVAADEAAQLARVASGNVVRADARRLQDADYERWCRWTDHIFCRDAGALRELAYALGDWPTLQADALARAARYGGADGGAQPSAGCDRRPAGPMDAPEAPARSVGRLGR